MYTQNWRPWCVLHRITIRALGWITFYSRKKIILAMSWEKSERFPEKKKSYRSETKKKSPVDSINIFRISLDLGAKFQHVSTLKWPRKNGTRKIQNNVAVVWDWKDWQIDLGRLDLGGNSHNLSNGEVPTFIISFALDPCSIELPGLTIRAEFGALE